MIKYLFCLPASGCCLHNPHSWHRYRSRPQLLFKIILLGWSLLVPTHVQGCDLRGWVHLPVLWGGKQEPALGVHVQREREAAACLQPSPACLRQTREAVSCSPQSISSSKMDWSKTILLSQKFKPPKHLAQEQFFVQKCFKSENWVLSEAYLFSSWMNRFLITFPLSYEKRK